MISPFARWAFPPLLGKKLKPADIPVIQRKVHWLSSPMTGRIKVGMLYFDLFTINHIHSIYIPICPSDIPVIQRDCKLPHYWGRKNKRMGNLTSGYATTTWEKSITFARNHFPCSVPCVELLFRFFCFVFLLWTFWFVRNC